MVERFKSNSHDPSGTMYQQLQLSGGTISGQPPGSSGQGASGVIPYDRNLYLTVTSPDGQDKEIIGAKACCQHHTWPLLKYYLCSPWEITFGPSLGIRDKLKQFVSTPILRDFNSQVDNIPGWPEAHGEGEHAGVSGAEVLGLLRGSEVHQLRAEDGGQCQGRVYTASGANIWRENDKKTVKWSQPRLYCDFENKIVTPPKDKSD